MSASLTAPGGRPRNLSRLRQLVGMAVLMWGLGFGPLFALMLVPGRTGDIKTERIIGADAQRYLEAKLAKDPKRLEAYRQAEARLRAKGKTRSTVVVTRSYSVEVKQTALRRIAEAFVPTLYARQYYNEVIWDDWSGYNPYYDGTVYISEGSSYREAQLMVSFYKDPESTFATASSEVIWYGGWEPDTSPSPALVSEHRRPATGLQARARRVAQRIAQAAYPTLCAEKLSRSWWDRLGDWANCTVSWCSGAAASCWIANVWNAEILWTPCFTAGCGGAEVACAVSAILQ